MAFYVYEYVLYKEYGYMNGTHFDEYWKQVGICDTFQAAGELSVSLADEYAEKHHGHINPYNISITFDGVCIHRIVEDDRTVGLYNKHKTIGGITVDIDPLPYMEVGYYILTEDIGDQRRCFSSDELYET